eukprot:c21560_g1_i1 orf=43-966(+)
MEVPGLRPQASSASAGGSLTSTAAENCIHSFLKENPLIAKPHQKRTSSSRPNFKQSPWLGCSHKPSLQRDALTLQRGEDPCAINGVPREQASQWTKKKKKSTAAQGTKEKKAESNWEILTLEQVLASLERHLLQLSVNDLVSILYKCRKTKNPGLVLRLHAYLRAHELEVHATLGNHLVSSLVELGSIRDAQQIFDRLSHRSQCSWNSLITHYVKSGDFKRAFVLYEHMQADGTVLPSRHTFIALLKACAKLKDKERGRKLHDNIKRIGCFTRDAFVGSSLIDMYAKCGLVKEAQEVFDKLSFRDVV